MALAAEQIDDLVKSTLNSIPKPRWGMIAQDLPDYPILNQMLRAPAAKKSGSTELEHRLMVTQSKTAKNVGLYATDDLSAQNNLKTIKVPWRNTTNNFIYDHMEKVFNSGDPESLGNQVVDLITTREADCMLGIAELMELAWWEKPTSTSDDVTPWGIQYWLKLATSGSGFNGGDISGFSGGPAGLASDTYEKWKHYNAVYDAFTDDDLAKEMRKAFRAIKFKSPVSAKGNGAEGSRYKIMTGEDVQEGLIQMARSQNDNLGSDIAKFDGDVVFKKIPIQYIPGIDEIWTGSENPIFMIDVKHFQTYVHKQNAWRRTGPKDVDGMHNVRAVYYDVSWNLFCTDRRRQAVLNRV